MSGLTSLLGGGLAGYTLLGMLAAVIFRPDRIADQEKFRLSVILLVASLALPAVLLMFAGAESMFGGGGFFPRLIGTISSLANAGSIYLLISSFNLSKS